MSITLTEEALGRIESALVSALEDELDDLYQLENHGVVESTLTHEDEEGGGTGFMFAAKYHAVDDTETETESDSDEPEDSEEN